MSFYYRIGRENNYVYGRHSLKYTQKYIHGFNDDERIVGVTGTGSLRASSGVGQLAGAPGKLRQISTD